MGIALAAMGISDVRSEWTQLPGIRGRVQQAARAFRIRAASFLWACWNRTLAKWPLAARMLRLRAHGKAVSAGVATVGVKAMAATGTGKVTRGAPPADGTNEERLAWLEGHIAEMSAQIDTLHARHEQEVKDRQDATDQEQAARMVEDHRIRERLADLAGGGLRLQAWGVACLLAGTVMTAIW